MGESDSVRLDRIGLGVRHLPSSLAFWREVVRLETIEAAGAGALLGAGGVPLIELVELPDARPDPRMAGLFHVALVVPDRAALGAFLLHAREVGQPLDGASDHLVSEAVYLHDPDGHGLELYVDRPRTTWRFGRQLELGNEPLDAAGLVAAAREDGRSWPERAGETRLGHVHLEALEVEAAAAFLEHRLGLATMATWPDARFLSWHGYHHHVAVNAWRRRQLPLSRDERTIGLRYVALAGTGRTSELIDPSGIPFRLAV